MAQLVFLLNPVPQNLQQPVEIVKHNFMRVLINYSAVSGILYSDHNTLNTSILLIFMLQSGNFLLIDLNQCFSTDYFGSPKNYYFIITRLVGKLYFILFCKSPTT